MITGGVDANRDCKIAAKELFNYVHDGVKNFLMTNNILLCGENSPMTCQ